MTVKKTHITWCNIQQSNNSLLGAIGLQWNNWREEDMMEETPCRQRRQEEESVPTASAHQWQAWSLHSIRSYSQQYSKNNHRYWGEDKHHGDDMMRLDFCSEADKCLMKQGWANWSPKYQKYRSWCCIWATNQSQKHEYTKALSQSHDIMFTFPWKAAVTLSKSFTFSCFFRANNVYAQMK